MSKRKLTRSFVPNLFTIANLFCGFSAIVSASQLDIERAAIFIFAGAFFDMIDGMAARITGATSEFGGELDSLSDVVTFGVAPSFMIYQFYFNRYDDLGLLISSIPAMMGALRLARFNIQLSRITSKKYFIGLPIPSNALLLASFMLFREEYSWVDKFELYVIFAIVLIPSLFMVSNVEFKNIPKISFNAFKENPIVFLIFLSIGIGTIITGGWYFFIGMSIYLIYSLLIHIIRPLQKLS